jgi:hypothetical protein
LRAYARASARERFERVVLEAELDEAAHGCRTRRFEPARRAIDAREERFVHHALDPRDPL